MKFVKPKDKKLTNIQKPLFFFFNLIPSNAKRQNFCVRREPQSTLIIKLTHTVFTLRARCPSTERREKGQKFNSLFFSLSYFSVRIKIMEGQRQDGVKKDISHTGRNRLVRNINKKSKFVSHIGAYVQIFVYISIRKLVICYISLLNTLLQFIFFYQPSAKKYKQHHRLCKGKKRPFFQKF